MTPASNDSNSNPRGRAVAAPMPMPQVPQLQGAVAPERTSLADAVAGLETTARELGLLFNQSRTILVPVLPADYNPDPMPDLTDFQCMEERTTPIAQRILRTTQYIHSACSRIENLMAVVDVNMI